MGSLLDRYVERVASDAVTSFFKSPEFKAKLAKHVGWAIQGYAPAYGPRDREQFTQTVTDRIRDKARNPVYLFGFRIWRKRPALEWCASEAERIVTDFLRSENIRFGEVGFYWGDGHDLADADMEYWEECP